jgi:hypothetical protein
MKGIIGEMTEWLWLHGIGDNFLYTYIMVEVTKSSLEISV